MVQGKQRIVRVGLFPSPIVDDALAVDEYQVDLVGIRAGRRPVCPVGVVGNAAVAPPPGSRLSNSMTYVVSWK